MQQLKQPCKNCRKPMNGGTYRAAHVCPHCGCDQTSVNSTMETKNSLIERISVASGLTIREQKPTRQHSVIHPSEVTLTTQAQDELAVVSRFNQLNSEASVHIPLTADMISSEGKFIGSKHAVVVTALKQAKAKALSQLREQAANLGANTLAEISVKNGIKRLGTDQLQVTLTANALALLTDEKSVFLTDA